ncbi:hypothetical protein CK203_013779 [Vitis vinifera]|uniref:RING-CH-type domain-containing protein n=1 Tax=Vitis vinifera TaxID=29760 RepID=A0A438JJ48_VITVI|nr:hypothetical protein CK203_013779 [Vitis vinifera]
MGSQVLVFFLISTVVGTLAANHSATPIPAAIPGTTPTSTPTSAVNHIATPTPANPAASPTLATPTSTMHLVATATATATPTPTQTPARDPATPTPRPTNDSAIPSFIASGLLGIIVGSFVLNSTMDMEEQDDAQGPSGEAASGNLTILTTILVSNGHSPVQVVVSNGDQLPPQTPHLSHDQCRVCYGDMEGDLIDLGCQCRGGLAKAHRTCIDVWFHTRDSNICEICQEVAANVPPPESQTGAPDMMCFRYAISRLKSRKTVIMGIGKTLIIDYGSMALPTIHASFYYPKSINIAQEIEGEASFEPVCLALAIFLLCILSDVLIPIFLDASSLFVNITTVVINILGFGTAFWLLESLDRF